MTIQYSSNAASTGFDATVTGSVPPGWTSITGAWEAITTAPRVGAHTNCFGSSTHTAGGLAALTGVTAIADGEIVATQAVTFNSASPATFSAIGLGLRGNSTGTTGYLVTCYGSAPVYLQLFKKVNGTYTALGTSNAFTSSGTTGDTISVRFAIAGSTISAKCWSASSAEPSAWTFSVTDTSITAAGIPWLYVSEAVAGQYAGVSDLVFNDAPYGEATSLSVITPVTSTSVNPTFTGTYVGTAPTGLNYALDGSSTYAAVSSFVASGGTLSFSLPSALSAQQHQVVIQSANATTETAVTGAFISGAAGVVIAPNNAAITYSPYNWLVGAMTAETINAGAYFNLQFTGTSCALAFTISGDSTPLPQIWVSIDGQPAVQYTVAATIALAMPSITSAWPQHSLEVVVKSTSEFVSRWSTRNASVVLTGITLDPNAVVSAREARTANVLFFGDSITEGYHTLTSAGSVAAVDTNGSDGTLGWAYMQREKLGVEVGVVGFGGTGLIGNGQGGVPPVGTSFSLLWAGQARTFTPTPNLIVVNEGTNDASVAAATWETAFQSFLTALLAAVPTCPIAVMRPFSGAQAAQIQAAIAAIGSSRLRYIDTTGFFNTGLSVDGVHPLGIANIGTIAPAVAAALTPILAPVARSYAFY